MGVLRKAVAVTCCRIRASAHRAHNVGCSRIALEGLEVTTLKSARLEEDGHHALRSAPLENARAVGEESQHAVVLAEDLGAEPLDAALGPRANDVVEEQLPQALSLVTVREDESDLGRRLTVGGLEASDTDKLDSPDGLAFGDQSQATPVV